MLDFKSSISKSFSVCDICPVSILVLKSTVGFLLLWIFAFVFFANVLCSMCSSYIKIEARVLCSQNIFSVGYLSCSLYVGLLLLFVMEPLLFKALLLIISVYTFFSD